MSTAPLQPQPSEGSKLYAVPDASAALPAINLLFSPEQTICIYCVRGENETKSFSQRVDTIDTTLLQKLTNLNQDGYNVYCCVNPTDGKGWKRENIVGIQNIYADFDQDGPTSIRRLSQIIPAPSLVINTGLPNRMHCIWKLRETTEDELFNQVSPWNQESAETIMKAIATEFEGDDGATRINNGFRLPGFLNWNHGEPMEVSVFEERTFEEDFEAENSAPKPVTIAGVNDFIRLNPIIKRIQQAKDDTRGERLTVGETIPEGCRNDTLYKLACSMQRTGFADAAIKAAVHAENIAAAGLPDSEVGVIIKSALTRPKGKPAPTPDVGSETEPEAEASTSDIVYPVLDDVVRYGFNKRYLDAIEPYSQADPSALLIANMVTFGNILGRGPHFVHEKTKHYCNEFAVIVGSTATGTKGTGGAYAKEMYSMVDPEWAFRMEQVGGGFGSGEKVIEILRDADDDGQIIEGKDKRLLISESEFATFLMVASRDGNLLSGIARAGWDGDALRNTIKGKGAFSTGHTLSILGHCTPEEFKSHISPDMKANGFINRFLLPLSRRSKVLRGPGTEVNLTPFADELREDILPFARSVGRMDLDDATWDYWEDVVRPAIEHDTLKEMARGLPHTRRLANIYALMDHSKVVRLEHMQAAYGLYRYCSESAKQLFKGSAEGYEPELDYLAVDRSKTEFTRRFRDRAVSLLTRWKVKGLVQEYEGPAPAKGPKPIMLTMRGSITAQKLRS